MVSPVLQCCNGRWAGTAACEVLTRQDAWCSGRSAQEAFSACLFGSETVVDIVNGALAAPQQGDRNPTAVA